MTVMFHGFTVVEVEPGTEIESNGETLTVTDCEAVQKGNCFYATPAVVAALKADPRIRAHARSPGDRRWTAFTH